MNTIDDVLRREMRQMESAPASSASIEQSRIRLERLGFFKRRGVETVEVPGTDDLIDVNFSVVDSLCLIGGKSGLCARRGIDPRSESTAEQFSWHWDPSRCLGQFITVARCH